MVVKVVVGTQFGDEGKGKIVDLLSDRSDIIARFNGGANAGHTVVAGGQRFAFRLLPSGAVRGRQVAIGNGVVVDPEVLLSEIQEIGEKTGKEVKLWLSDRAHVVMPYHKVLDGAERQLKGGLSSGSTKRGIGPCYGDKVTRVGFRVGDLVDPETLREKMETYYPLKQRGMEALGLEMGVSKDELLQWCIDCGKRLSPCIGDTSVLLNSALDAGHDLLLEGAQGTLLDIDHGVYPYGTSSNPTAGGACTGTGISPLRIHEVLGVVKGYTSRVGEGPFPTEIQGPVGDEIREKGGEYGTVTRRPRRCGWLDLVMVKYALRVNGATGIALTKMDVLGGLADVNVCVAYDLNGEEIQEFPASLKALSQCRPVYESLAGWEDMSAKAWTRVCELGYEGIPPALKEYIDHVSAYLKTNVSIISLGQDRLATIEKDVDHRP